jgi:hypothetical protein
MKSPVLFIVFNRPETTKEVFKAIAQARPDKLYVAADGPRSTKSGEKELCELTRKIATSVDWPCQLITRFQETNLGCKYGVSSAIDWFFENEEEGIILEDDVLPHESFFKYCDLALDFYRDDERVMMVTGTNHFSNVGYENPTFFSQHFTIWGWASWRRAWKYYDVKMAEWQKEDIKKKFKYQFGGSYIWRHFRDTFDSLDSTYVDTWDIQWVFACLNNSGLCLTPKVNLISNIGVFGTHGNGLTDAHFMKSMEISVSKEELRKVTVSVNANYDLKIHESKTIPAQRRRLFTDFLKGVGLYKTLKKIKNRL